MASSLPIPPDVGHLAEGRLRELAVLAADVPIDAEQQAQVVLTVATLAEAYSEAVLRQLIIASSRDLGPFARAMYAELEDRIFQSWEERHSWLAKGFGIKLAGSRHAQDLQTLVDLRNALVHGAGTLTDRQSRDLGKLVHLETSLRRTLDVHVERGRVHLTESTGHMAVSIARAYILALDASSREAHPGARI